jgi:hypothetical protein
MLRILVSAFTLGVKRPARLMTIFYCLRFETPLNLEDKIPVFISPRERVAQLYPHKLSSLFVSSYDLRATVEVFESASTRQKREKER